MTQYRPYNVYRPDSAGSARAIKSKTNKRSFKKASLLGLAVFILIIGIKIDTSQRAAARAAEQSAQRQLAVAGLKTQIHNIISSYPQVDFSVAITDAKYGLSVQQGSSEPVDAASTSKLLTAALFLDRVEKKRSSLSQKIDGKPAKSQLREMVQKSSDVQWHNFNTLLSHKSLEQYATSLNLMSYSAETNTMTASDITRFLKLLNENKILSVSNTNLLLSFMVNTNYEEFISPAVDSYYELYHKVGVSEDQVNDVAIISTATNDLYISILTNGNNTYNWPNRANAIQQITKLALNAYLK